MAESKRNILDLNTGFNVMINLYVIRYLYSHMDNKAKRFMDEGGQRKKSNDFYLEIGISRQRFQRILGGQRFEMSFKDRKYLSGKFNIGDEYFNGNGKAVELNLVSGTDWKAFFNHKYPGDGNAKKYGTWEPEKVLQERVGRVEKALSGLLGKNVVENTYGTDTAIYRIHYYWKNGTACIVDSNLTVFTRALERLQIEDWAEIENDIKKMEKYRRKLAEHAEYLRIVTEYKRVKKK